MMDSMKEALKPGAENGGALFQDDNFGALGCHLRGSCQAADP